MFGTEACRSRSHTVFTRKCIECAGRPATRARRGRWPAHLLTVRSLQMVIFNRFDGKSVGAAFPTPKNVGHCGPDQPEPRAIRNEMPLTSSEGIDEDAIFILGRSCFSRKPICCELRIEIRTGALFATISGAIPGATRSSRVRSLMLGLNSMSRNEH